MVKKALAANSSLPSVNLIRSRGFVLVFLAFFCIALSACTSAFFEEYAFQPGLGTGAATY